MKKKLTLATNIGDQDRHKYGLTEYEMNELTEGKEISIDEKFYPVFVQHGWVKADKSASTEPVVVKKPTAFGARADQ